MQTVIFANQANRIVPDADPSLDLLWEIDDDDHLTLQVTVEGIDIRPDSQALGKPERTLRYTAKDAGISEEIQIMIKPENHERASESGSETDFPGTQETFNTILPDTAPIPGTDFSGIPKTLKASPQNTVHIAGTENLPDDVRWSFSDERHNACLKLDAKGVHLTNLPPGLHTLLWRRGDGPAKEIVIQSIAPRQAPKVEAPIDDVGPAPLKSTRYEKQTTVPDEPPPDAVPQGEVVDGRKNWPKTPQNCALVVGSSRKRFPVTRSSSLLIGKRSRHQSVVDVDLKELGADTEKVSRNHLKVWFSDLYLMMKNIGHHRVYYGGREVLPDQLVILKIGGEIQIGDVLITVVEG